MVRTALLFSRRAISPFVLAMFILTSSWLTPSAAQAQAPFTQPGLQRVTVTKTPLGPDRGYAYSASSHADLLSISQLILKLTRELLDLVDSNHGSVGSSDGPTLRDFELMRKLAQLRQAVQQRRQLQMAQVLEQAVEEMAREEAEAQKQGKEPTQQEAEEAARQTEQKIEQRRAQLEDQQPQAPAAPQTPLPATPPPATRPAEEDDMVSEAEEDLKLALSLADTPPSRENLERAKEIFNASAFDSPGQFLEHLKKWKELSSKHDTDPKRRRAFEEKIDSAIKQLEQDIESGDVWLGLAAKLFEAPRATQAEMAEDRAMQDWRRQRDQLRQDLENDNEGVRWWKRNYDEEPSDARKRVYEEQVRRRDETRQKLRDHEAKKP